MNGTLQWMDIRFFYDRGCGEDWLLCERAAGVHGDLGMAQKQALSL